jgi:disulfide bond formation protein DsbB
MSLKISLPSRVGLCAFLGSAALLGGAYYFQYVVGLAPCEMCLWQRYPHMVAIAAGLIAVIALGHPNLAMWFALVAITALAVTAGIGVFHVGVEHHWWPGPTACTGNIPRGLSTEQLRRYLLGARMIRCDEPAWVMWGVSMAGWNAILSGALAVLLGSQIARHIRTKPE